VTERSIDGIVGYCDGGASPNPGFTGSGIHAYTYVYPKDKERPSNAGTRHIATDKGYVLKSEIKPDQIPVKIVNYIEMACSLGQGTNNIGEIAAAHTFLTSIVGFEAPKVLLITDSKLVVNATNEWLDDWVKRNWIRADGTEVKNKDHWGALHTVVQQVKKTGELTAAWVLGHNNDYGNVMADYLASAGVNMSKVGPPGGVCKTYTPEEYKAVQLEIHPFLCLKRVYFNSLDTFNSRGLYYQTDAVDEKYIMGKRTGEVIYSVVKLQTPDVLTELAIAAATSRPDYTNTLLYTKTDRLNSPLVKKFTAQFGQNCFTPAKKNMNVDFLDKKPIVFEVKGGELQLRAIDILSHLEEILESILENGIQDGKFLNKAGPYRLYDITDHFYETSTKKSRGQEIEIRQLKKEFGNGVSRTNLTMEIELPSGEMSEKKFPILFGLDIPDRNTLKRIEVLDPQVLIVTWPYDEKSVQYGVVVKSDDAAGIWTNYFANLIHRY
jgi:ribonuclease HI